VAIRGTKPEREGRCRERATEVRWSSVEGRSRRGRGEDEEWGDWGQRKEGVKKRRSTTGAE